MAFIPLFCQSHHSPRGVNAPSDLVRRARSLGYNTLGLCDEGSVAGYLEFDDACRSQGLRPIFGCRLRVEGFALQGETFPADFLIESEQGYRNLMRLLNAAHQLGEDEERALRVVELRDHTQGLSLVIPPDGEYFELLRRRDRAKTEQFIKTASEICGAGLVFGLLPPAPEIKDAADDGENKPPCMEAFALQLARFTHVKAMAAPRVAYAEPGDDAAAAYLANPAQSPGRQYKPPEDVHTLPALWPENEVLEQYSGEFEELPHESWTIARRCNWRIGKMRRVYPSLDLERGFDPNSYLFDLVLRGAAQRYGEITETLKQRINKEIEDIRGNNLAPYLLLNYQIAQALDQRGLSRGVGRGRLISSVSAYCLGITRLDPTEYRLAWRTLMLDGGEQLPSVNIEVPRAAMPTVLAWLRESFGEDHLAEIGRIQEWRRDQMIVEVANWAGMTDEERKLVQREKARLRSTGAAQRLGELAETHKARRWRDAAFLGDVVARLAPRPRHWAATGDRFVLSSESIEAIVPLVAAQQERPVTGMEEDALDRLGLARITFVPHNLLDILDHAIQLARGQRPGLNLDNIPTDDRATFELVASGDTIGIPPLESITLRCILRRQGMLNLLRLLAVKNEAANVLGQPAGERPRELSDHLPDVLLSYQCAWLKTHFPLAFFGAVLSGRIEQRENPAALIRAARRLRIAILPPDINLSDWFCTHHAGQIRLGLAAIKGFGQRAWENVSQVRSGGNFVTLEDFCERIDTRLINLRTLRALAASGAMDGLDPQRNRARLDAKLARLQKRARDRNAGADDDEPQPMLFDMEELGEPEETQPEWDAMQDWNDYDKEVRQTEALGFALHTDPVAAHKIVCSHLKPKQVEDVPLRPVSRPVRVAGLVCAAEKTGAFVEEEDGLLIDLEGIPVVLAAGLARHAEGALEHGTAVLVIGTMEKGPGTAVLRAQGLWRLADMEDQATKVSAVKLHLAGENRQTLKLLLALAKDFPGNTMLHLANYPEREGWTYRRLARTSVFFCSPFYQGLCKILPPEAVELFGPSGEPLLIKTAPVDTGNDDEPLEENELPPTPETALT